VACHASQSVNPPPYSKYDPPLPSDFPAGRLRVLFSGGARAPPHSENLFLRNGQMRKVGRRIIRPLFFRHAPPLLAPLLLSSLSCCCLSCLSFFPRHRGCPEMKAFAGPVPDALAPHSLRGPFWFVFPPCPHSSFPLCVTRGSFFFKILSCCALSFGRMYDLFGCSHNSFS